MLSTETSVEPAKIGVPSFVVTLGFFLGFQGLQLIMLGDGGIYRVDIPAIQAIMNENMPEWAGWAMLVLMLVSSFLLALWDRGRRVRAGLATRPIAMLYIRLAVMAALGGIAIAILNQNRSVSIKAIAGVPIVLNGVAATIDALSRKRSGGSILRT